MILELIKQGIYVQGCVPGFPVHPDAPSLQSLRILSPYGGWVQGNALAEALQMGELAINGMSH